VVILFVLLASIFPTITALIGILLNRRDAQELRGGLSNVREQLTSVYTRLGHIENTIGTHRPGHAEPA
jgi:hypothetical protein